MDTLQAEVDHCNTHGQPSSYSGERGDFLVAAAVHRDSDTLACSNWQVLLDRLGGESETIVVERFFHWAVGWIDYLLVDPADTERVSIAEKSRESLNDYPVLDEEHFSNLEYEKFYEYAASELKDLGPDWAERLHAEMEKCNGGPGDDSAESEMIEAVRASYGVGDEPESWED